MKVVLAFIVFGLLLSFHTPVAEISGEQRTERLEQLLTEVKDHYNIPAIGVIVVNSDRVIDSVSIGRRDIHSGDPATSDDYFHLGSNTKAITAFIAAKLVHDGAIDWETRFFDLVPELTDAARDEYANITFGDLLSHRAWVRPYRSGAEMEHIPALEGAIQSQRIEFARYVLEEEPVRRPLFKRYAYSNAGYVLIAVMMERATGRSWEQLVQDVMVEDLGLPTRVGFPIEIGPDQPRGHLPGAYLGEGKDVLVVYDTEYVVKHEEVMNPAGDLCMPMTEYARFIQLHLRGLRGEDNYLPAETYEFMHFGIDQYGMGWENAHIRGMEYSEHSGSRGNFFCHVRIVPGQDLAIIVFANSGILNALNPVSYFFGGIRLARYFDRIEALYAE